MNRNCKDHRGVTHALYNATRWRATWCGTALVGTTWTNDRVDCMTCLVTAGR